MAKYLQKDVDSIDDYNEYCWFVAGLVGEGLSQLFVASDREDKSVLNQRLYRSMGLFLQKVNITRDYHEDILSPGKPRMFYPKAIWGKYAANLEDFLDPNQIERALGCLNEMVTNAMEHAVDSLDYLNLLTDPHIFRFCALPQVMAIATLNEVYNNPMVFRSEVKIRKSLSVHMALNTNSMKDVYATFLDFSKRMRKRIPTGQDVNDVRLREILDAIDEKCTTH